MPTTATIELGHRFADDVPDLVVEWQATQVPSPALIALNAGLAAQLGLDVDWLQSPGGVDVLAGNATPPGAEPVAMGYAGHQFGNPSPQLGDGRALLLGELTDADGQLHDVHLKGSGRTPFARGGDGKATLGPMLREFLVSEAMHALGIPTTRSLAVVTTGEQIARQRMEPGAILARTASSHIRVGTFQFARWHDDGASLRPLLAHTMARHCPGAVTADRPALALFEHTVTVQAQLIARWMLVGFIHGVMNTDNTTISGETIDYGPCAFMDRFDPATVYSSIDHGGRYAYGNQPAIAQWNLARLAEAMLPEVDADRDTAVALVTEAVEGFVATYQQAFADGMAAKLGLDSGDGHSDLFDELLALLHRARADFTSTFRQLADRLRGDDEALRRSFAGHISELDDWLTRWDDALGDHDSAATADAMDTVNPVYIPRNHLVEAALDAAAVDADLGPFHALLDHVTAPYVRRPGSEVFEQPAPEEFDEGFQTFCGT